MKVTRNILLLILILSFSSNAKNLNSQVEPTRLYQQLDSLASVEKANQSTLSLALELCHNLSNINTTKAIVNCKWALQLSKDLGDERSQVLFNLLIADNYSETSDFKTAMSFLNEAKTLVDGLDDRLLEAHLELYYGIFFNCQTANEIAEKHFRRSLKILTNHYPEHRIRGAVYNNIGLIFLESSNQYDSALFYFNKALTIKSFSDNAADRAVVYLNLGSTQIWGENYDLALAELNKVNQILLQYNDYKNLSVSETLIAKSLRLKKEFDSVLPHLKAAESYNKVSESPLSMRYIYEEYINYFWESGQTDSTINYFGDYISLMDSLMNIGQYYEVQRMMTKHEQEIAEREIQLKGQSIKILKKEKLISQLTTGILTIALILIITLLFFIRNQGRKRRLEAEKEKILSETQMLKLQNDLDLKSRELTSSALQIIKNNDFISTLKEKLDRLYSSVEPGRRSEVNVIRKSIDASLKTDQNWEEFITVFEQVHQGFNAHLKQVCPDISPSELKLSALLKLNFSSKQISEILGISSESVRTARYRLRKKLELPRNVSLVEFMVSIQQKNVPLAESN